MPTLIPYIIIYIFIFLAGACIGSFYNVIAARSVTHESFVKGRSHCPKCNHTLSAIDLVPFFSYLFLKGKCRYCKAKISIRYPIVELIGGLSAVFCVYKLGLTLQALLVFYVISLLITLSLIDLDIQEIPNGFHIAMIPAILFSIFLFPEISIGERVIGFFAISVPMLIIAELVNGIGFGGGDIKLMAMAGAFLGWKGVICAFFAGIIVAAVYCIYLLAFKKAGRKTAIAFGPYLAIGIIVAVFYADPIINWYLNTFFYGMH